ncbi:hypothetical protein [Nocardioides sp. WS12]|uniref:hypothetical protein n=1 Tax=Nocardioides sp. WS12 TaxID=2486272 RepID=UPI0015F7F2BE|nr:hypothetical protein [Nocardioides sp. WS12]
MSDVRAQTAAARRVVAATAFSLTLVTVTSGNAEATTDYTPTGGPGTNFVGSSVTFTNVEALQTYSCSRLDAAGQVAAPGTSRAFNSEAVDLGALTDNCTHPVFGLVDFDVDPDWGLSITGSPSGTSWPTRLDQVDMTLSAVNCDQAFEGSVDGTFDIVTQRFTPITSDLVVTLVVGSSCTTFDFQVGDHMELNGQLTNISPAGSVPLSFS